MDGLWATKSEGVGLIVRAISLQDFQPRWSLSTNFTDGQTVRRTTCNRKTALCTIIEGVLYIFLMYCVSAWLLLVFVCLCVFYVSYLIICCRLAWRNKTITRMRGKAQLKAARLLLSSATKYQLHLKSNIKYI